MGLKLKALIKIFNAVKKTCNEGKPRKKWNRNIFIYEYEEDVDRPFKKQVEPVH